MPDRASVRPAVSVHMIVMIDDLPFVPIRLNLYEMVRDKREELR